MNSLSMAVLDERAGRPNGNPFKVRAINLRTTIVDGVLSVGVGLSVRLAKDMDFAIKPLRKDIHILGSISDIDTGELTITVMCEKLDSLKEGEEFAQVTIVEQSVKPVRFIEVTEEGSRVVTGSPKEAIQDG